MVSFPLLACILFEEAFSAQKENDAEKRKERERREARANGRRMWHDRVSTIPKNWRCENFLSIKSVISCSILFFCVKKAFPWPSAYFYSELVVL